MKGKETFALYPITRLAYDDGKCRIGFNYNCLSDEEHYYLYAMMNFIAMKVGRKRTMKIYPNMDILESVSYYVYDGDQTIPVREKRHLLMMEY